jgi:putative transposase
MKIDPHPIAARRYQLIQYLQEQVNGGWTERNLKPLLQNLPELYSTDAPVNWRTICRWRKKLLESNGDINSLIPSKGTGVRTVKTVGDDVVLHVTIKRMLKQRSINVMSFYREYEENVNGFNCLIPDPAEKISKLTYKTFKGVYWQQIDERPKHLIIEVFDEEHAAEISLNEPN